MNNFEINQDELKPREKAVKSLEKIEQGEKWALSKIFWLEGLVVIIATLLISVANIQLGVTSGIQPASTVIRSILLWICSYLMYTVYLSWGSQKGKDTNSYGKALKEYQENKTEILKGDYTKLADYCTHYVKEELKNARISILTEIGLKYEEYEKLYLGKSKAEIENLNIADEKKLVIIQANLIKPTKLTPSMIMTHSNSSSRNLLGIDVEKMLKREKGLKLITSALFSMVIGSIFIDVSVLNGWSIFISCVLNLIPLAFNIFMGAYMGYKAYSVNEVNNLNGKTTHFKNCLKFEKPIQKELGITENEEV